ncbi:hypothetical protein PAMP_003074 [Pampus punctatissimus]
MERKIPDFAGTWEMKSSENFEELLKALGGKVQLDAACQHPPPSWFPPSCLPLLTSPPSSPPVPNASSALCSLTFDPGRVNMMLRKIAVKAASKPLVEITQDGETLSIKTSTSVRTTHITFTVGQEFSESTVDGRPCTSFPRWETDSKISCEQTLQKGEGPKTSWTREITNDGKLILTMGADDVVCTRVYERQ